MASENTMQQNAENVTYRNVEPYWEMQGSTSFCKARSDWMEIGKLHLSFVQHAGRNKGCQQLQAFETAIDWHGERGALVLIQMILSGEVYNLAAQSKANPVNGYAQPFFEYMGGSNRDGVCKSRIFSVAPGMKTDFVFTVTECEGQVNSLGGYMPKKDAPRTSIRVPLSARNLIDFAVSTKAEYEAYRTKVLLNGENTTEVTRPAAIQPVAPTVPAVPDAQTPPQGLFCIIYDNAKMFNGGVPIITTLDKALRVVQDITRQLLKMPGRLVANTDSYNAVAKLCEKGEKGVGVVSYTGKENAALKDSLVVVLDYVR